MKWKSIFIIGVILLGCSCSQPIIGPTISGTIRVLDDLDIDKFYIGLYDLSRFRIGVPIEFSEQAERDFTFEVEPGQYTVVVYSFETEKLTQHILIPEDKTRIRLEITLPPRGIGDEIDTVGLIGDFNEWNQSRAMALTEHEGRWMLEGKSPLTRGDKYNYLVNGTVVCDITQKNVEAVGTGAELRNIYSGNELVFDPADYYQPAQNAAAHVHGSPFYEEYSRLVDELAKYDRDVGGLLQKFAVLSADEYAVEYRQMAGRLDGMKREFPKMFHQAILDKRLDSIVFAHPAYCESTRLRNREGVSEDDLAAYYVSDKFVAFFTEQIELLKGLDPESVLAYGEFGNTIMNLGAFLERSPELARLLRIGPDYFYNFLIDFVKKSPHKKTCARLLFDSGSYYARREKKENAEYLINWLKEAYPDDRYVGEGWADKVLASLNTLVGAQAPDFEIETLDGDNLKLKDFRGRFVFLDFWGVWCGPCRAETPNLVRLHAEIPDERLQIIGIAVLDPIDVLKTYIADNKIEYPNTLVTEEDDVIEDYGITAYPTTLMINPEGVIIAKNLRGERLTELVREKMEEYKQK